MSDPVEEFLAREKDGLAGLEDDIPSALNNGENRYIEILRNNIRVKKIHFHKETMYQWKIQKYAKSTKTRSIKVEYDEILSHKS